MKLIDVGLRYCAECRLNIELCLGLIERRTFNPGGSNRKSELVSTPRSCGYDDADVLRQGAEIGVHQIKNEGLFSCFFGDRYGVVSRIHPDKQDRILIAYAQGLSGHTQFLHEGANVGRVLSCTREEERQRHRDREVVCQLEEGVLCQVSLVIGINAAPAPEAVEQYRNGLRWQPFGDFLHQGGLAAPATAVQEHEAVAGSDGVNSLASSGPRDPSDG